MGVRRPEARSPTGRQLDVVSARSVVGAGPALGHLLRGGHGPLSHGIMIGTGTLPASSLALAVVQVPADIPEGLAAIATLNQTPPSRARGLLLAAGFSIPIFIGVTSGTGSSAAGAAAPGVPSRLYRRRPHHRDGRGDRAGGSPRGRRPPSGARHGGRLRLVRPDLGPYRIAASEEHRRVPITSEGGYFTGGSGGAGGAAVSGLR